MGYTTYVYIVLHSNGLAGPTVTVFPAPQTLFSGPRPALVFSGVREVTVAIWQVRFRYIGLDQAAGSLRHFGWCVRGQRHLRGRAVGLRSLSLPLEGAERGRVGGRGRGGPTPPRPFPGASALPVPLAQLGSENWPTFIVLGRVYTPWWGWGSFSF